MSKLQLSDVTTGEVFLVRSPHDFPHPERKTFLGMVVGTYYQGVTVRPIEFGYDGELLDTPMSISQDQLHAKQGDRMRRILHPYPQFRRWADNSQDLLSFNSEHPAVPTGVSLDELLRYERCAFIVGVHERDDYELPTASFRRPFFDFTSQKAVRQHVTVFELDDSAQMVRTGGFGSDRVYRLLLPDTAQYREVNQGPVADGTLGMLQLGPSLVECRTYNLYRSRHFAIETKVLERAGLATPGVS